VHLAVFTKENFGSRGWPGVAGFIRGRRWIGLGFMNLTRSTLAKSFGLVCAYGNILLDMIAQQDGEASFSTAGADADRCETFGSIELGDGKGQDSLGRNNAGESDTFWGLGDRLLKNTVEVESFSSPSDQEGLVGLGP
jgi:hypothetical protein